MGYLIPRHLERFIQRKFPCETFDTLWEAQASRRGHAGYISHRTFYPQNETATLSCHRVVTNCHNTKQPLLHYLSPTAGLGGAMTAGRDHIAAAYLAVVTLLESKIISVATRRQVKTLREMLEEEMAADANKSHKPAA